MLITVVNGSGAGLAALGYSNYSEARTGLDGGSIHGVKSRLGALRIRSLAIRLLLVTCPLLASLSTSLHLVPVCTKKSLLRKLLRPLYLFSSLCQF